MIRYEVSLMNVRMHVSLPAVTVLMLMLNVLMLVQNVRVRMRYIPVAVLVSVLRGHLCSIPGRSIRQVAQPYSNRSGLVIDTTHLARTADKHCPARNKCM